MAKQRIAVVTDSAAYIPEEETKDLNIPVIPLWLIWGEQRFRDGVDIHSKEFYQRLRTEAELPTTSQPSAGEFVEFFKQAVLEYEGIVSINVTSKLSGTVGSAQVAVNLLPDIPIRVVDTLSISMGMGFPVLAAARAAKEGCSLDEVTAIAEDMVRRTHLIFVVDTLENLRKGGRISGAKAFLGTAMSIKPLLHFEDGMIMPLKQVRTRKKAIAAMLDEIEQRLGGAEMAEVAVIDGDAEVVGDEVAEMVKARFGPAEVLRSPISPVIGTHAGPGAVGVAFYMKE